MHRKHWPAGGAVPSLSTSRTQSSAPRNKKGRVLYIHTSIHTHFTSNYTRYNHTHTHTHTRARARARAHAHRDTHKHTRAHTNTHTHAHTCAPPPPPHPPTPHHHPRLMHCSPLSGVNFRVPEIEPWSYCLLARRLRILYLPFVIHRNSNENKNCDVVIARLINQNTRKEIYIGCKITLHLV